MAIYPVVKGQKFDPKMVIPPRRSKSQSKHENQASDLIDADITFGENLAKANTDKQGPLDDFEDLKKDLPARNQHKKADDNDSHDEDDFHDAHEG